MSGVIQTGSGINTASLRDIPKQNNGILVTMVATAGMDLSRGISVADNQGNTLSRIRLFEMWDQSPGSQSVAVAFYGLIRLPAVSKGAYAVNALGLPTGPNGGVAELALFEVNGLRFLDQVGSRGSTAARNQAATETRCPAANASSNDLVIAAFGVPDTLWINPPRDPPGIGYTSVASEVIARSGGAKFAAVQVAYKVVQDIEISAADWGRIEVAGADAWPWISSVASFGLSDAAPSTNRGGLKGTGLAAVAPLAWIIERRRRRAGAR
jgi:hypothetical protein